MNGCGNVDARGGSADGRAVLVGELREPGAGSAPAAGDAADCGCRPGVPLGRVAATLCLRRAAGAAQAVTPASVMGRRSSSPPSDHLVAGFMLPSVVGAC